MSAYQDIVNDVFQEDGFNPAPIARTLFVLALLSAALVATHALGQQSTQLANSDSSALLQESAVQVAAATARNEREYYRGLFDTCVAVYAHESYNSPEESQALCLGVTAKALEGDWYGTESRGWRWPLDK